MSDSDTILIAEYQGNIIHVFIKDGTPWFSAIDICLFLSGSAFLGYYRNVVPDSCTCKAVYNLNGEQYTSECLSQQGVESLILEKQNEEEREWARHWFEELLLPTVNDQDVRSGEKLILLPEFCVYRPDWQFIFRIQ